MSNMSKKFKKLANTQNVSKFKKLVICLLLLFTIGVIVIFPGLAYFAANTLIQEILNIKFNDVNLTNILITITFSLFAIVVALIAITKSKRDDYFLAKRINRNYLFEKYKELYYFWIFLFVIGFILCIFTSDLNKIINYSIVISFMFLIRILTEIIFINKTNAEIYYIMYIKQHFSSTPFINQTREQIDKFYEIILSENKDENLIYSGEYIIIKELNNILAYLYNEKDNDKKQSYIELYNKILTKFSDKNYFELSLFYYLLLIEKVELSAKRLIEEDDIIISIDLIESVDNNYIKLLNKIKSFIVSDVVLFLLKNKDRIIDYKDECKLIYFRLKFIFILIEKLQSRLINFSSLFKEFFKDSVFIDQLNELQEKEKSIEKLTKEILDYNGHIEELFKGIKEEGK